MFTDVYKIRGYLSGIWPYLPCTDFFRLNIFKKRHENLGYLHSFKFPINFLILEDSKILVNFLSKLLVTHTQNKKIQRYYTFFFLFCVYTASLTEATIMLKEFPTLKKGSKVQMKILRCLGEKNTGNFLFSTDNWMGARMKIVDNQ